MVEKSLNEIDLDALIATHPSYTPSPVAWEDQVLYFMMLDRFSDGREKGYKDNNGTEVDSGITLLFSSQDSGNAVQYDADAANWREAGSRWTGGNLKGLTSKIGYLKRLGVTAIWVSPIFKQVSFQDTYHGYGIQNFIDIDPHFGTREELKEMVKVAHANGLYVVMDIILNHSGNVFSYNIDRYWTEGQNGQWYLDPRWDGNHYQVAGYNDVNGDAVIPYGTEVSDCFWPNGGVWPKEFQEYETFTRKGHINSWDYDPEYLQGDFCDLKDIKLGEGQGIYDYRYSKALRSLAAVYRYWIAYADIDGFRVDTVKHMDDGATRFFTSSIHEFAQSIGKENFYLIGEITGGRHNAFNKMEATGLNAALGINEIPGKLEYVVKGYANPQEYFELFRNSLSLGKDSHVWFRNKVVTMFDDHDQVRKGNNKARFCADMDGVRLIGAVMALNLLSEGIPCIYYGTEQGFDGMGDNDRYLRETMFGGDFGAFRSKDRHFFDESKDAYRQIQEIIRIRKQRIELSRGRQYLRQISGDGQSFGYPVNMGGRMTTIIAWSRIFNNKEVLVAINTDPENELAAWVTIDNDLHESGDVLTCIGAADSVLIGHNIDVQPRNGKAVYLSIPSGRWAVFH